MIKRGAPGVIDSSRRRGGGGTPTVLGQSSSGATDFPFNSAGRMHVTSFTLASAGTLTELHGWFKATVAANARVVIYDDDGSGGLPGTRLAYSSSLPITPTDGVMREFSEAGFSLALAAGTYWVGWITDTASAAASARGDNGVGAYQGITSGAAYSPPPSSFGTPNASGTRRYSCWGVVLV